MILSTLQTYIRGILAHIPGMHWAVIGVGSLALTVFIVGRKKCSVYGAIALGVSVFSGLFLLDTAVVIRYLGMMGHESGYNLAFDFERIFRTGSGSAEMLSNLAAFVPFGFFLAEFWATLNRTGSWRRVGLVTLTAFGLSLCIECLQLLLHVGFFEVTDLVMNTVGAFVGALMSVGVRKVEAGWKCRVIGEGHV